MGTSALVNLIFVACICYDEQNSDRCKRRSQNCWRRCRSRQARWNPCT